MRTHLKQYRRLSQTKALSRSPLANHFYSAMAAATPPESPHLQPLIKFLPAALWQWISTTAQYLLTPKHHFIAANEALQSPNYTVPNSLRIAIAGDWGTGTEEAFAVNNEMQKWDGGLQPDLTIHLGDVYYVGGQDEMEQNCLGGIDANGQAKFPSQDSVLWSLGKLGGFAMNGNHEMYAKGNAYFDIFLPRLGMLDNAGKPKGQGASFLCLENDYWRILAIDTGYNSNNLLANASILCQLEDALISWLEGLIPSADTKATVLLSHHQYFSAFEDNYPLPAKQLSRFFKNPILWIWGHEHRAAGYDLFGLPGISLQAHGRCIGHGGMPVDALRPDAQHGDQNAVKKLVYYDARRNPIYDGGGEDPPIGINGFAHLTFEDMKLTIQHKFLVCDPNSGFEAPQYSSSETLLTETFTCAGPVIQWGGLTGPTPPKDFIVYPNGKGSAPPPPAASGS